jgi:glutathione S-transferase
MKLYTNRLDHFHYYLAKVVAEITQAKVQTVVVSQQEQETAEFKAKRTHGKFPMLELENGTIIYESNAIAEYFARTSPHSEALCGSNAYEEA